MSFKFEPQDFRSSFWMRLSRYLEERRATLREENDSMSLDDRHTAFKRGAIAELTELLDAARPQETP